MKRNFILFVFYYASITIVSAHTITTYADNGIAGHSSDDGPINLFIADMNGKNIYNLINNESYLKGSHSIIFTGNPLSEGNYFCVLETTQSKQVFKLIKTH